MVRHVSESGQVLDTESDSEEPSSKHQSHISTPSKRSRAKLLAKKAKAKSKQVLGLEEADGRLDEPDVESEDELSANPAFDPGQVLDASPPQGREETGGVAEKFKMAGNAIVHPRRAMRSQATKSTATRISSQRPFLSADQDRELLRAHDILNEVTSNADSNKGANDAVDDGDADYARQRVEKIEQNREDLRTAWIIGRHVHRVKAVRRPLAKPRRKDFVKQDASSTQSRWEWERWLGHLLLYYTQGATAHYVDDFEEIPFDIRDLIRIVERLSVVSASWQAFFLKVRQVYMWDDPKRTAKWMVLYWALWYTEHIIGFCYAYVIYITIRNRYYPTSVQTVRQTMVRAMDHEAKAQAWGELIEKHGRDDWVEPLLDELGPLIQMQLGDLCNFLEVLTNFYRWELPNKTAATLFFFCVCLAITVFADMRFCMKVIWFINGSGFFFVWPIACRFPQYRVAVDPFKWPFWDIPTHAELGIIGLQRKVIIDDANANDELQAGEHMHNSIASSDSNSDFATPATSPSRITPVKRNVTLSSRAYIGKKPGRLTVTREGLSFRLKGGDKTSIRFSDLVEVRKVDAESRSDRLVTFQSGAEGLDVVYKGAGGEDELLKLIVRKNDRHKIFSHVLAWSNLKWQVLHLERHNKVGDSRSDFDRSLKRALKGL